MLNKLFEFIREEKNDQIPEMAINTLLKLIKNSKNQFKITKNPEIVRFVMDNFDINLQAISRNMLWIENYYKAISIIVSVQSDFNTASQMLFRIMQGVTQ